MSARAVRGLPRRLRIPSTAALFDTYRHFLHTTSAVRFPVFIDGRDYTGHRPGLLETPVLRQCATTTLVDDIQLSSNALVVPLGKAVSAVMAALIKEGTLDADRCLLGFPHPSGQNGHRIAEFRQRREELTRAVAAWWRRHGSRTAAAGARTRRSRAVSPTGVTSRRG